MPSPLPPTLPSFPPPSLTSLLPANVVPLASPSPTASSTTRASSPAKYQQLPPNSSILRYSIDQQLNERDRLTIVMVLYFHPDINEKIGTRLQDIKMQMLGSHQLQNAGTATCVALCLRYLGWRISDESIRSGLEHTYLLGRSQFLTSEEAEVLGLNGATILLDGAHTRESAKALMNTIRMAFPEARLAFVVAMANDKDHVGFAREILSGVHVETVLLTEAAIAGGVTRTTPASLLRDSWIQASEELGVGIVYDGMAEYRELLKDQPVSSESNLGDGKTILATETPLKGCLRTANKILIRRRGDEMGVIVITGSLHIVSSVLVSLAG